MPRSNEVEHPLTFAAADLWRQFDPSREPVVRAISGGVQVGTSIRDIATADVLIYSVFGERHRLARGTTVAISAEPRWSPDYAADWSIDWRHLPTANHLRVPVWARDFLGDHGLVDRFSDNSEDEPSNRRFCNFLYANPRCGMRNAFFEMLNAREPVDALGSVHHNTTHPRLGPRGRTDWRSTKQAVLGDYRFTIAFENEEHCGYITEKIVNAWMCDSVPIYWGDPAVDLEFPEGSYLSLYAAGTMARLVEQVLEAHHDPQRYATLRAANPFRTGQIHSLLERYRTEVDDFGGRIRADAAVHRGRPRRRVLRRAVDGAILARHEAKSQLVRRMD